MRLEPWQESHWTEGDVVAELCHQLKLRGLVIRCEVRIPSEIHRSKSMRCDVAVMKGREIACILEVKHNPTPYAQNLTRQGRAYAGITATHGIPTLYVWGMDAVPIIVEEVIGLMALKASA